MVLVLNLQCICHWEHWKPHTHTHTHTHTRLWPTDSTPAEISACKSCADVATSCWFDPCDSDSFWTEPSSFCCGDAVPGCAAGVAGEEVLCGSLGSSRFFLVWAGASPAEAGGGAGGAACLSEEPCSLDPPAEVCQQSLVSVWLTVTWSQANILCIKKTHNLLFWEHYITIYTMRQNGAQLQRMTHLGLHLDDQPVQLLLLYCFFFCLPSYIWGSPFRVRFLCSVTVFVKKNQTTVLFTFCLHGWCMLGVFFVAGIHPSRTWTLGSFESLWWNTCVHRLVLSVYSHPKESGGNRVRTKGKNPLYRMAPRGLEAAMLMLLHKILEWYLMLRGS